MVEQRRSKEAWGLFFLYPLAAFLVILALKGGGPSPKRFGRDWPYILGGPIGALVWWLIVSAGQSWLAIFGGYLVGAGASLLAVWALRAIEQRYLRTFD